MRRFASSVVPHVVAIGAAIAVATGFVAARFAGGPDPVYTFTLNVIYWLLWSALAPVVLYLGTRVPITSGRRLRALGVHTVASVVCAVAHLTMLRLFAAGVRTLAHGVAWSAVLQPLPAPARLHLEWEITMYWGLVGLAHAVMFREEARNRELRAAHLEGQLAHAQLQALQRQLQPHFLFNTLQTISALVHRDAGKADRMIERLGDLLRTTLRAGEVLEVPLERELEHVRHYAAIEQANLGDRLRITIDVPSDVLDVAVPSLLLQPLVENAVRHGLAPRAAGGSIAVRGWRDGDAIELRVEDDGLGLRGTTRPGIGLENTRQRLAQMYGEAQRFEIRPRSGGGVEVCIRLPRRYILPVVAV